MSSRRERGFTLIEALVGLALLSLVLMVGLATLYRLPRDLARERARVSAARTAESIYEELRTGELPLEVGSSFIPIEAAPPFDTMEVLLTVNETAPAGLFQVRLDLRYVALAREGSLSLTSLVWRP